MSGKRKHCIGAQKWLGDNQVSAFQINKMCEDIAPCSQNQSGINFWINQTCEGGNASGLIGQHREKGRFAGFAVNQQCFKALARLGHHVPVAGQERSPWKLRQFS